MATVNDADFRIDAYNLDREWVRQPELYRQYASALADAKMELDEAKNDLSVIKSEVEKEIRQDPEKFGLAKVTEAAVAMAVPLDTRVRDAEEQIIVAKHKVGLLEAAVGALDHKKRALSDLVSLHLADYFSEPTARKDGRETTEDFGKEQARRGRRRRGE